MTLTTKQRETIAEKIAAEFGGKVWIKGEMIRVYRGKSEYYWEIVPSGIDLSRIAPAYFVEIRDFCVTLADCVRSKFGKTWVVETHEPDAAIEPDPATVTEVAPVPAPVADVTILTPLSDEVTEIGEAVRAEKGTCRAINNELTSLWRWRHDMAKWRYNDKQTVAIAALTPEEYGPLGTAARARLLGATDAGFWYANRNQEASQIVETALIREMNKQ